MAIGTLSEKSLHAALKMWYALPDDQLEVPLAVEIDGKKHRYHIDLQRANAAGEMLLIEIQTRSFTAIRRKLRGLVQGHQVRLVYPIAAERWLVDCDAKGCELKRRRSPKRGRVEAVFAELIAMPDLTQSSNFSLEVLLIRDEEIRRDDGKGSWRRKHRSIADRRLLAVLESRVFHTSADYAALIPPVLLNSATPFTVRELAKASTLTPALAGKMAYCLWKMDILQRVGKRGNAILYTPNSTDIG